MNYLAHLFLVRNSDELMVGGYLGDFVKGHVNGQFSPTIQLGIHIHRKIDSYTDSHPVHKYHRSLFSSNRRRYAGVILDIAYDHFLSNNWESFTDEPKNKLIERAYKLLQNYNSLFPYRAQQFLHYMLLEDVLNQYHYMEGIKLTINRLANRGKTHPTLIGGHEEIEENYDILNEQFVGLFKDIITKGDELINRPL